MKFVKKEEINEIRYSSKLSIDMCWYLQICEWRKIHFTFLSFFSSPFSSFSKIDCYTKFSCTIDMTFILYGRCAAFVRAASPRKRKKLIEKRYCPTRSLGGEMLGFIKGNKKHRYIAHSIAKVRVYHIVFLYNVYPLSLITT